MVVGERPAPDEDLVLEFAGQPAALGNAARGQRRCSPPRAPGAATAGDRNACRRRSAGRPAGGPRLHLRREPAPGRADRPEQVAPRRRRVGVLRDQALPARATGCAGSTGAPRCAPGRCTPSGPRAQEDSSVLILLDAVIDVGASGGLDGEASALDVGVRAASALTAHHIRVGDRVALRVLGQDQPGARPRRRGPAPATAAGAARAGPARLARPARRAPPAVPRRRGHAWSWC